ncbi:MAG: biopolymer transporter ExbD [Marinirhabdus sp.]|nr:biopolymer transporter ExbD [Marinirhabdus sp.]
MKASRTPSTISAGSMADIAFLLLLFFLASSTISQEKGIVRKLPDDCKTKDCSTKIAERNMLRIHINASGEYMLNQEVLALSDIKSAVTEFIDNNGNGSCSYCEGKQLPTASVHPSKAVISLSSHRNTPYSSFIAVQDELTKAYKSLRLRYASQKFGKAIDALTEQDLIDTQKAYPFIVSEATVAD